MNQQIHNIEFCLVSFLLTNVHLLSIIIPQCESAPNKEEHFGNANSIYLHWIILLEEYVGWSKQSTDVFQVFVYSY